MPTPQAFAAQVLSALERVADPARAEPMARYMKGHFPFLGVPQPLHVATLKALLQSTPPEEPWLLEAANALWALEPRECQYAALSLLKRHSKRLTPAALPGLEGLTTSKSWWDTVDVLAAHLFGGVLLRFPGARAHLERYSTHENLWLRRVAILHQLSYKSQTDAPRLFACCLESAPSREFFLQKAIGWALREYAKTDPEAVLSFVKAHRDTLPRLSVREALKHQGPV